MSKAVMIGPSPASRGGMASVIAIYLQEGLGSGPDCVFLATQCDGGALRKLGLVLGSWLRFMALLLGGEAGVLHAHVASGVSFWRKSLFIVPALALGCPVVFHLHGGQFADFVAGLGPLRRGIALRLIRRCQSGLVLTREARDWLRDVAGLAATDICPNPVLMPGGEPAPQGRTHDVVFIGRLEHAKGVFDLVEAFCQARAGFPRARLLLCGDGDLGALQALVAARSAADVVEFMGWVDTATRTRILATAGVYVLASHIEQMPMTVLEAMAMGTPVVATRVGAVPDLIVDSVTGAIVEPGDIGALAQAIRVVLSDPGLAQARASAARRYVAERHASDRVVAQLRQRHAQLMGQGQGPR